VRRLAAAFTAYTRPTDVTIVRLRKLQAPVAAATVAGAFFNVTCGVSANASSLRISASSASPRYLSTAHRSPSNTPFPLRQPPQHILFLRRRIPNPDIFAVVSIIRSIQATKILSIFRRTRPLPANRHVNRTSRRINVIVQHRILRLIARSPQQAPPALLQRNRPLTSLDSSEIPPVPTSLSASDFTIAPLHTMSR